MVRWSIAILAAKEALRAALQLIFFRLKFLSATNVFYLGVYKLSNAVLIFHNRPSRHTCGCVLVGLPHGRRRSCVHALVIRHAVFSTCASLELRFVVDTSVRVLTGFHIF